MSAQAGGWWQRLAGWFWRRAKDAEAAPVARFGGDDESPTELVAVFTGAPLEAQVVLGRLQSEDIPAMIRSESAGTVYGLVTGPLGEAQVLVPAPLADRAIAVLSEPYPDEPAADASAPAE